MAGDQAAVAQDADAVREALDLPQAVGDEDDAGALLAQPLDPGEEHLDFGRRQGRRGLVEQ